jgi:hypothetical protein
MRLSLAVEIESRNGLPMSDSYILNGYVQTVNGEKKVAKRPGLSLVHQFSAGTGQGAFTMSGNSYAIIADKIVLLAAPWTSWTIPAVTVAGLQYQFVANPPYITTPYVVLKSTAGMWQFDGTTVSKVTDPDYPAITVPGVAYLDGTYYVKTPAGRIYGSDLANPLSWTALNFLTVSDMTGISVAIGHYLTYLVSFSQYSTTFYWDAANPPPGSPLSYAQNLTQAIGCAAAGSIAKLGDAIFFLSQTLTGRSVSMITGAQITPVSTPSIDSILDLDDLSGVYGYPLAISGRLFYILSLVGSAITLCYNLTEKHWTYWSSGKATATVPVTLTLGSDLTTVTGTMTGTLPLAGTYVVITGATNPLFNGMFLVTSATATYFTYTIEYSMYLLDSHGNILVTEAGDALVGAIIPVAGTVAGNCQVSITSNSYFTAIASAGNNLLLDVASGVVEKLDTTTYTDYTGPIDFNIVTKNLSPGETSTLTRIAAAEVKGDKVLTTGYLRYSDTDYKSWSGFRALAMNSPRVRTLRLGATRRRAFHFRHVDNTPLRVEELLIDIGGADVAPQTKGR